MRRLVEMAGLPNVQLQVVPFSAGAWPAFAGAFAILQFPDEQDPDVAYIETSAGGYWAEAHEQVIRYHHDHQRWVAGGLSQAQSVALIRDAAAQRAS